MHCIFNLTLERTCKVIGIVLLIVVSLIFVSSTKTKERRTFHATVEENGNDHDNDENDEGDEGNLNQPHYELIVGGADEVPVCGARIKVLIVIRCLIRGRCLRGSIRIVSWIIWRARILCTKMKYGCTFFNALSKMPTILSYLWFSEKYSWNLLGNFVYGQPRFGIVRLTLRICHLEMGASGLLERSFLSGNIFSLQNEDMTRTFHARLEYM